MATKKSENGESRQLIQLRLLAARDFHRIFAVDLQMMGKGNKFIKEFAVFGKHYRKYMMMEHKKEWNNSPKTQYANKTMETIHGIPLDQPGEPKIELCKVLQSLCDNFTNPVAIVCGHNKKVCLENFIQKNQLPPINIINIEHYIQEIRKKNNALPNIKQILDSFPVWNSKTNKLCPIGNTSAAHINRCAQLRAIDLYNNFVLWISSDEYK